MINPNGFSGGREEGTDGLYLNSMMNAPEGALWRPESLPQWFEEARAELFNLPQWQSAAHKIYDMIRTQNMGHFMEMSQEQQNSLIEEIEHRFRTNHAREFAAIGQLTQRIVDRALITSIRKMHTQVKISEEETLSMMDTLRRNVLLISSVVFQNSSYERMSESLQVFVERCNGLFPSEIRKDLWLTILCITSLDPPASTLDFGTMERRKATAAYLAFQFKKLVVEENLLGPRYTVRFSEPASVLFFNSVFFHSMSVDELNSLPPTLYYVVASFLFTFLPSDAVPLKVWRLKSLRNSIRDSLYSGAPDASVSVHDAGVEAPSVLQARRLRRGQEEVPHSLSSHSHATTP